MIQELLFLPTLEYVDTSTARLFEQYLGGYLVGNLSFL